MNETTSRSYEMNEAPTYTNENTRLDGKPAHVWKYGAELGLQPSSKLYDLEACKNCGVLRGDPKYPETPCKGAVHVTTR